MPKLSGVFDQFADLDKISSDDINKWLKIKLEQHGLDNFIANRIYYPQTVPLTPQEMEFDLAILKEGIKRGGKKFYNLSDNKIVIPEEFVTRFHPTHQLVAAFIDGLDNLKEVTQIFLQQSGSKKLVGSVFIPAALPEHTPVVVKIDTQKYSINLNTLTLLPAKQASLKISIDPARELIINGGSLGIFVDLRRK